MNSINSRYIWTLTLLELYRKIVVLINRSLSLLYLRVRLFGVGVRLHTLNPQIRLKF